MDIYRYRLQGRSLSVPSRVIRITVNATDADEARRIARIRNPDFGTTLPRTGVRRVGRVVDEPEQRTCRYHPDGCYDLPEQADGMTQAKAREFVEWRGCEVEVV